MPAETRAGLERRRLDGRLRTRWPYAYYDKELDDFDPEARYKASRIAALAAEAAINSTSTAWRTVYDLTKSCPGAPYKADGALPTADAITPTRLF
jgi:DNA invertase Pin-like site-specific DNA recombinase